MVLIDTHLYMIDEIVAASKRREDVIAVSFEIWVTTGLRYYPKLGRGWRVLGYVARCGFERNVGRPRRVEQFPANLVRLNIVYLRPGQSVLRLMELFNVLRDAV